MTITFDALRAHYPTVPKSQLFAELGGQWPSLINNTIYENTCAVRLSVALRKAGAVIPAKFKEAVDGAGAPLVLKVKTMGELLKELLKDPFWGMSKQIGSEVRIPAVQGIIVYHVQWTNATGHFDLWTGSKFVGAGDLTHVAQGHDIALWAVA